MSNSNIARTLSAEIQRRGPALDVLHRRRIFKSNPSFFHNIQEIFKPGSRTEHYFQNFQGSGFEHEQGKRSSPGFLVTNRSTGAYKFMNQGYKKTRLRTRKLFSSLPEAMRMPAGDIDL